MDSLLAGHGGGNRPLFRFQGRTDLPASAIPKDQLTLSGPSRCLDAANWPVRGDLAHIRLAGICFVPHYAAPMPHRLSASATLRIAARDAAEGRESLAQGALFNVLDISGGWAWGQVGEAGCVGYLPMSVLDAE